jgi:integrase
MTRRGNSEGSVYKRADGRWAASVSLTGGKRKSYYGSSREEVAIKLVGALKAKLDGLPAVGERQSLGQFLTHWLENSLRPSVRDSTYRGYESKLRMHVIPALGHMRLTHLAPQHLEAFFNRKVAGGLAPQTVQHLRAIIRAALNDALKWGLVGRNAAALVDGPRVPHSEIQPFSPDEARSFLQVIEGERLAGLYCIAIAAGLRQGEALALMWGNLDLEAGTVAVQAALQYSGGSFHFVEPKSARSRRMIALPIVAVAALRRQRVRQAEERLAAGPLWEDWGLVFTTATGRPLQGSAVTRGFQQLLARTGMRRQRFHDLRHACASLLLAEGVHPRVIMETLGHSGIALTMNTYSHVLPALQREAANSMDRVLSG